MAWEAMSTALPVPVAAARSMGEILLLSMIEVVKLNCCGKFLLVVGSQSCLAG